MKLLAVETSTEACSVALFIDGLVKEKFVVAPRKHAKLILPMLDSLLSDAQLKPQQLDAIALGRGPGSFTGVRVAASVVQGIAFGADLPVVLVSTLAAMAQNYFKKFTTDCVYTALDARMGEIFWAVYQKNTQGFAELIGDELVTLAEKIVLPKNQGIGLGSAWAVYQQQLTQRLGALVLSFESNHLPKASAIAELGAIGFKNNQAVAVEFAMPIYLRDKVAKKTTER